MTGSTIKLANLRRFLGAVALMAFLPGLASADYVLSAPPRETPEAGKQVYGPLAEHLSSVLGEPVRYEHPGDWRNYEKKMKKGEYDILFDGPHFAAWRINQDSAQPLVKLPGSLRFVLVARADRPQYTTPESLIGARICTLPSPNLGALTLYSMYPNPARQPEFFAVSGGFAGVAREFQAGKCDAAVLRKDFYDRRLTANFKADMRVVQISKALTNQGITVSSRIDADSRESIRRTLVDGSGSKAAKPLMQRFAKSEVAFETASGNDYTGHNLLRDNMIFGW